MVCCGQCGKWQHISCHDQADQRLGRPKRNWDLGQFFCRRCQAERNRSMMQASQHVFAQKPVPPQQHHSLQAITPYTSSQQTSDIRLTQPHALYTGASSSNPINQHLQQQQYARTAASLTMTQPRPDYSTHSGNPLGGYGSHYQGEMGGVNPAGRSSHAGYLDGRSTPDGQAYRQQYVQPYTNGTPYGSNSYANGDPQVKFSFPVCKIYF